MSETVTMPTTLSSLSTTTSLRIVLSVQMEVGGAVTCLRRLWQVVPSHQGQTRHPWRQCKYNWRSNNKLFDIFHAFNFPTCSYVLLRTSLTCVSWHPSVSPVFQIPQCHIHINLILSRNLQQFTICKYMPSIFQRQVTISSCFAFMFTMSSKECFSCPPRGRRKSSRRRDWWRQTSSKCSATDLRHPKQMAEMKKDKFK